MLSASTSDKLILKKFSSVLGAANKFKWCWIYDNNKSCQTGMRWNLLIKSNSVEHCK